MEGSGSGGENGNRLWALKRRELGLNYSGSKPVIHRFKNLGLKSTISEAEQEGGDSMHPLRPHAEDCNFYVRTGTCRFGSKCKYNHPVLRQILKVDDEDEEDGSDGLSDKSNPIACKFYPTVGGCKNGDSCKFIHSQWTKSESGVAIPELNFVGLPMRLGEKECPFYMRIGLCAYGSDCRFHYPDPTVEGSDLYDSSLKPEAVGYFANTAGYINDESFPHHFSMASSIQASWPSYTITDDCVSYMDNRVSNTPATSFYPEGLHQTFERNGCQAHQHSLEKKSPSVSAVNTKMDNLDLSKKVEESPESPAEPNSPVPPVFPVLKEETYTLNELGLPLRPGEKVCPDFETYGLCRHGCACPFDHPMDKRSPYVPNHMSNTFVHPEEECEEGSSWDDWYNDN